MNRLSLLLPAVLSLAVMSSPVLAVSLPGQAFVKAGESGQAILYKHYNSCYAITPEHVMGGELFASLVGASTNRPVGDADWLQTFGYDLSILAVAGALQSSCDQSFPPLFTVDELLRRSPQATVSSVNESGGLERKITTVVDQGLVYFRIRPSGEENRLYQGLSGSLVIIDQQPAGILQSVDADTGEGKVLRIDRTLETIRPFFDTSYRPEKKAVKTSPLGAGLPMQAVSWSEPPFSGQHRADNLTQGGDSYWQAPARFPQELVFELEGEKAQVINAISLIGDSNLPQDQMPRDFEIAISGSSDGSWLVMSTETFIKNREQKSVMLMPVKAKRVKLTLYSNWGDLNAVALKGVAVENKE